MTILTSMNDGRRSGYSPILPRLVSFLVVVISLLTWGGTPVVAATSLKTSVIGQQWSLGLTDGGDFQQAFVAAQLDMSRINNSPFSLSAYVPYAWTSDNEADATLTGVGDALLRGSWKSRSSRWALTAGVDVPTGKTPLSASEYIVATRILASRVLDFNLKRPGEGLDLMASVAHSIPIGRTTVLGFAVAGFMKGEYDVASDTEGSLIRTAPGDRVHVSVSLIAREHDRNPDWDWRTNLVFQIAGDAHLTQGTEQFDLQEGMQGSVDIMYGRRLGRSSRLQLSLFLLGRDVNQVDGRDLLAVEILGIGTRWAADLGAIYTWPVAETTDLSFGVAHTMYQIEPAEDINSQVTSFQLQASRRFVPRTVLAVDLRYGLGSTPWTLADQPGTWERRDLRGWSVGLSTKFFW